MSLFITFEGMTGSGKTTQLRLLTETLRGRGCNVLTTREPGGTAIGDRVRDILLDPQYTEMQPLTGVFLFSASRAQLLGQVIRPHLQRGGVVLCDRYADSTLAYQGYGRGVDLDILRRISALATGDLIPDLTFYLDLPTEQGLERRLHPARTQGVSGMEPRPDHCEPPPLWEECDRLDLEQLEFHERVRQGYLELAAAEPQRWVVIRADRTVEEIQADILRYVEVRLAGEA